MQLPPVPVERGIPSTAVPNFVPRDAGGAEMTTLDKTKPLAINQLG